MYIVYYFKIYKIVINVMLDKSSHLKLGFAIPMQITHYLLSSQLTNLVDIQTQYNINPIK